MKPIWKIKGTKIFRFRRVRRWDPGADAESPGKEPGHLHVLEHSERGDREAGRGREGKAASGWTASLWNRDSCRFLEIFEMTCYEQRKS